MKDGFWQTVVERGRIVQWITVGGGMLICLVGGILEFLSQDMVYDIIMLLILAAFGLESMIKTGKSQSED